MGSTEYKSLPAYEKLKQIQELNFCRAERHSVALKFLLPEGI